MTRSANASITSCTCERKRRGEDVLLCATNAVKPAKRTHRLSVRSRQLTADPSHLQEAVASRLPHGQLEVLEEAGGQGPLDWPTALVGCLVPAAKRRPGTPRADGHTQFLKDCGLSAGWVFTRASRHSLVIVKVIEVAFLSRKFKWPTLMRGWRGK